MNYRLPFQIQYNNLICWYKMGLGRAFGSRSLFDFPEILWKCSRNTNDSGAGNRSCTEIPIKHGRNSSAGILGSFTWNQVIDFHSFHTIFGSSWKYHPEFSIPPPIHSFHQHRGVFIDGCTLNLKTVLTSQIHLKGLSLDWWDFATGPGPWIWPLLVEIWEIFVCV